MHPLILTPIITTMLPMSRNFSLHLNSHFCAKKIAAKAILVAVGCLAPSFQFNFDLLFQLLNDLTAERVKGVLNTDRGCYAFNVANGVVSVTEMSLEGFESRLEVIDSQLMPWSEFRKNTAQDCRYSTGVNHRPFFAKKIYEKDL